MTSQIKSATTFSTTKRMLWIPIHTLHSLMDYRPWKISFRNLSLAVTAKNSTVHVRLHARTVVARIGFNYVPIAAINAVAVRKCAHNAVHHLPHQIRSMRTTKTTMLSTSSSATRPLPQDHKVSLREMPSLPHRQMADLLPVVPLNLLNQLFMVHQLLQSPLVRHATSGSPFVCAFFSVYSEHTSSTKKTMPWAFCICSQEVCLGLEFSSI